MRATVWAIAATGGGCGHLRDCAPVDPATLEALPARLSETGLFSDLAVDTVSDGVSAFAPRFPLWSDGAEKRRWIRLPEGGVIDTSDVDRWRFPVGTRLWKEFTRDGVRVETRVLDRIGPEDGDWAAVAYVWNDDGTDAVQAPEGREDARGTAHDVPAAADCWACHGGRESVVLGFSAIQLAGAEGLDLDDLVSEGRLTEPPTAPVEVPGDDLDQQALGLLHANCSHCHNPDRPAEIAGARCYSPDESFDFTVPVGSSLADVPVLETALDELSPGDAAHSAIVDRISRRRNRSPFAPTMPPLANEEVNAEMVDVLTRWIDRL